jgi:hypothetical protein
MLRKVVGNDRSKEGRGKKWRNGEREKVDRRRGARRDCESRSRYNTGGYSHSESEKEKERVKKKKIVLVCGDVKKKKKDVCSGKVDRLVDFGDVWLSGGIYLFFSSSVFFFFFSLLNISRNDYQKLRLQESTLQRDIIRQHLIMYIFSYTPLIPRTKIRKT